jgi:anaerobic selenocysteine-containing dehydrogenase
LMNEAADASDTRMSGCLPSALSTDSALEMHGSSGQPFLVCGNVTPATPSGRVELYSDALETRYGFGIPRHVPVSRAQSLTLISPSSPHRTNSTFGGVSGDDLETVEIHPEDARSNSVADGDEVTLSNDLGEVVLRARITEDVPPGVVYCAKGAWLGSSPSGQTVNALISADNKADIMDGACYNDTFVDIAPRNA